MRDLSNIPAVKFKQSDFTLLNFALEASVLSRISYFNPREIDRETGIQRDYSRTKSKQIAEYIDNEASVLPNNIIINLELDKLKLPLEDIFSPKGLNLGKAISSSEKYDEGIEELKGKFAFVIDGQHRLRAFEYSLKKEYLLNVTALINLNLAEVAEIFVKINYYQKPINKSLVFDLLGISEKIFPEYYSLHKIVEKLNEDLESPLYNDIKMLGTGAGIITQASLITALTKYKVLDTIKKNIGKDEIDVLYKIIWIYFTAIRGLYEDLWGKKESTLTKNVGLRALIKLLNFYLEFYMKENKKFKVENLKKDLEKIPESIWTDPEISTYGGEKGVDMLYNKLKSKVE